MITADKVKIFARWDGDVDMFARAGRESEKKALSDSDWSLIESMVQDHIVIKRSLGSETRVAKAKERFKQLCENDQVVNQIGELAEKVMRAQKFRVF